MQRLEDLLEGQQLPAEDVIPVALSPSTTLRLYRQVVMTRSDHCHILVFRSVPAFLVLLCVTTPSSSPEGRPGDF